MPIEVLDGMEGFYGSKEDVTLLLNAPIYGTKQAAFCFYKTLVKRWKISSRKDQRQIHVCIIDGRMEN